MAHVALQRATHFSGPHRDGEGRRLQPGQGGQPDEGLAGKLVRRDSGGPRPRAHRPRSPWSVALTEFTVAANQTSFKTNQTYRFTVTNKGVLPHEFMIVPAMSNMGQMDMASLDAVAIAMIPVDELPARARPRRLT